MYASDDLSTLLSKAGQSLTLKLLLDTLQQTIEFESAMSKKWATPVCILHLVLAARIHTLTVGPTFEGDFVVRNSLANNVVRIRSTSWYFRGRAGQVGTHPQRLYSY